MKDRCLVLFKRSLANLVILVLSAMVADRASAALVVDIESKVIDPGGQQDFEIYLTSNSGDQELFSYDLAFNLVPVSATTGTTTTFNHPLSEDFVLVNDYVFYNDTAADGRPNMVLQVQPNPTIVRALDETLSRGNVIVGSDRKLVSRLTVTHNLNGETPEQVGGDIFEIKVGREAIDEPFRRLDDNLTEIAIVFELGERGFITVATVPEPGTFAFTCLIALEVLAVRRRRRQQIGTSQSTIIPSD